MAGSFELVMRFMDRFPLPTALEDLFLWMFRQAGTACTITLDLQQRRATRARSCRQAPGSLGAFGKRSRCGVRCTVLPASSKPCRNTSHARRMTRRVLYGTPQLKHRASLFRPAQHHPKNCRKNSDFLRSKPSIGIVQIRHSDIVRRLCPLAEKRYSKSFGDGT